ncbi:MAG TPA: zinc-binding dehydrogenase [Actinoplanes sp.]|jgi:L-iditol 2-dehydrogenase|nr:zinc-binding dehydrogenase [Actinoplanes sp.]
MRVARLYGAGDIRLTDEAVPEVPAEHSLVRVAAVGLCGSDLHWYAEAGIGDARLGHPLVIGHEFAGVIEGGPRHGEPVALDPAIPCGVCELCQEGHRNLCVRIRFAGHGTQDGALREFVAWPSALLHSLPAGLTTTDGAMLEPLGVAIHAVDLAHLRVGASVGVFGCGPIGLLLLQVARAAGAATIVAVDPLPHRLEAARRFGADLALTPDEVGDPGTLAERAGGNRYGVHVAFEVAGTDDAVALAVSAARPGARVVLVGIPAGDRTSFPAGHARRKGLTILMSRRMKEVYPRAVDLVRSGRVDVRSVVSAAFPLAEVDKAFEVAVARTGLKVVVEP